MTARSSFVIIVTARSSFVIVVTACSSFIIIVTARSSFVIIVDRCLGHYVLTPEDRDSQGLPGIPWDSLRLPGITCSAEVCWSFLFLDIFGFAYTSAADEAFGGKKFFLDNRSCSLDVSGVTLTDHLPRGRRSRSYKQKYQNHESVVC